MSDALSEEFFAEVGDKYYPQVLEGLERLSSGDVAGGIEILARPLHTIKGVTGFMPGFEAASAFTHKVESFLKKLQAGTLEHSADNISLAAHGVNSVFAVIEQIRDQGAPDQAEIDAVCEVLAAAAGEGQKAAQASSDHCVAVEQEPGATVLRLSNPRIHLKSQSDEIVGAILALPQTAPVVLDVSAVKSFGSSVWEDVAALADMWTIGVRGLGGACRENFYAWDFDAAIRPLSGCELPDGSVQ
ncbi:MAG: Hpt domain-containing protein [Humidesulfovibrio sp.]|nr:Hpt domain-containing protein [Humidesulfovibrio sp.]